MFGGKKKKGPVDPSGYLGDLNEFQQQCLDQIKQWTAQNLQKQNPWFNDAYLLRFCRARKFDIVKVIEMFSNFLKFREENNIDQILNDFEFPEKEQVLQAYGRGYYGVDKIGRPIYIEQTGSVKVKAVTDIISEEKFWQSFYHQYEELLKIKFMACSILYDRQINQTFSIIDLKGFNMGMWNKTTINFVKFAAKISQDYYPEIMGKMVVCHAPMIFTGIYNLIKGWIDEKTRKKISLVGDPKKLFMEYVDMDQLPQFLGGTNDKSYMDDFGPWKEYELVDSNEPGAVVGIRRKGDPENKIFTPTDCLALENPSIEGMGVEGTKGAMICRADGTIIPNLTANKSTPIEEEKYVDHDDD